MGPRISYRGQLTNLHGGLAPSFLLYHDNFAEGLAKGIQADEHVQADVDVKSGKQNRRAQAKAVGRDILSGTCRNIGAARNSRKGLGERITVTELDGSLNLTSLKGAEYLNTDTKY
eukprot:TRINITY_DN2622_c0_g1_i1.p2 TRINITY_DN2622_c0_g1~~TRINITY_DN2622_c0_g1_i1.p2  ORF type:complete len:116 (-),score=18.44 TRINITY_DN2622_c0_g1_i1:76-423(-)